MGRQNAPSVSALYCWLCLLGSITFEVAGTSIMKVSQGSWAVVGLLLMYAMLGLSYYFLARAVMRIPLGVAYAFWEGLGLVAISIVSVWVLNERMDAPRIAALGLVLVGTLLVHHGTEDGAQQPQQPKPQEQES